jgi:hypothetical protein
MNLGSRYQLKRGEYRVNKGIYGGCILYPYMKIEEPFEIILSRRRGWKRENDGGGESN